jgi:hypothetical protein
VLEGVLLLLGGRRSGLDRLELLRDPLRVLLAKPPLDESLQAERLEVTCLDDLERVDHPHRGPCDEQPRGEHDQGVPEVPLPARARWDEPGQQSEHRQQRSPHVEVCGGAPL